MSVKFTPNPLYVKDVKNRGILCKSIVIEEEREEFEVKELKSYAFQMKTKESSVVKIKEAIFHLKVMDKFITSSTSIGSTNTNEIIKSLNEVIRKLEK